ncbi:hypothetical protein Skr01_65460 [Sphaerisporangium krabiense]|nr:hypothetical protein Skr01_65460 [Sphaerisporangium krabiense]
MRISAPPPRQWTRHLRQADGESAVRVDTADETAPPAHIMTAAAALADPAVTPRRSSACEPLAFL